MATRLLKRFRQFLGASILLSSSSFIAAGSPITWTLSDVRLQDGSSVAGSFTFDPDTNVRGTLLTNFQISITGGSTLPALLYTPSNRLTSLIVESRQGSAKNVIESVDAFGDRSPSTPRLEFIYLAPSVFLTDAGGTIPLQLADSYAQLSDGEVTLASVQAVSGAFTSAATTAVPEPGGRGYLAAFGLLSFAAVSALKMGIRRQFVPTH